MGFLLEEGIRGTKGLPIFMGALRRRVSPLETSLEMGAVCASACSAIDSGTRANAVSSDLQSFVRSSITEQEGSVYVDEILFRKRK